MSFEDKGRTQPEILDCWVMKKSRGDWGEIRMRSARMGVVLATFTSVGQTWQNRLWHMVSEGPIYHCQQGEARTGRNAWWRILTSCWTRRRRRRLEPGTGLGSSKACSQWTSSSSLVTSHRHSWVKGTMFSRRGKSGLKLKVKHAAKCQEGTEITQTLDLRKRALSISSFCFCLKQAL